MNWTRFARKKLIWLGVCTLLLAALAAACICRQADQDKHVLDGNGAGKSKITISGDGVAREITLSLDEMLALPDARFEHVYSIINNWPSKKFYAARGIKVAVLLEQAGIKNDAKRITFIGKDGYEWSFTRGQLLDTPRYYYPGLLQGNAHQAEEVDTIIAYELKEDSTSLDEVRPENFCLIVPQASLDEQTNHAFVKGVARIEVDTREPGKWEKASVFPAAGQVKIGDKVKLQHKDMGKVKIYYTCDGSTPDEHSILYNPSTYQPDLNRPIVIDREMTVKVLVKGFGKYDSDISEFRLPG